jgi:hypothetical protein
MAGGDCSKKLFRVKQNALANDYPCVIITIKHLAQIFKGLDGSMKQ